MLNRIFSASILLGLITMIFYTPMLYARGILSLNGNELTKTEKVISCIPVLNIIYAESMYTGKISLVGFSIASLFVSLLVRLVVVFTLPTVFIVQLITVALFLLSLIFFFVANAYAVFIVIKDSETKEGFSLLFNSIAFPLGQYYIGTHLPTIMKNLMKEEETFK